MVGSLLCRRGLAFALLLCSVGAGAATVQFQQRNYDVSLIPLANNVPASAGCDLIFVILPSNQKYLCIPSDASARACFDPATQRFYRVDRANGLINGFSALSSTLITTSGTFFQTLPETPALNGNIQSSLESYTIPLDINTTLFTADIAILDDATIAYRSSETKIYEIDRSATSFTKKTTPITTPPLVAPGNVAVDYDIEDGTLLLVEPAVNDSSSNPIPDRISSYFRDGTKFDELILDNNTAIPGYTGNASGIAWDVDNGDIYVLDNNHLIYFKLLRPTLTLVSPNHGPASGNISVTITGSSIPQDGSTIVYFGGIQATNIVVNSSTSITCTVPAHALGAVNVTMTGTGIVVGSPVTLTNGFTYANAPPVAVLSASPKQGPEPLTVNFDITGSLDPDGTLTSRIIDFGDGNVYAFPADVTIVTVSHTYPSNGTFTATLTVTDNSNATATASQLIIVGTGGVDITDLLVLKTLALKIAPTAQVLPNDRIKMTGLVVLPTGVTPASLSGGTVSISVNAVTVSSTTPTDLTFGSKGIATAAQEKFTLKLLKKPGFATGTYTFTYVHTKTGLTGVKPGVAEGRAQIPVIVRIFTPLGRSLSYVKTGVNQAVVQVKTAGSGATATLSLVRK